MKALFGIAASAFALLLAGCGSGGSDLNAAANQSAAPLHNIAAPNAGDWTQVVSQTPEGGTRIGNPDAPVKLVEYGSLTCPACRAFSMTGTTALRDTYVRSGQVSWEFRHLIIHGAPDVVLALLANCQPPAAFFRTIEQVYDQQSELLDRIDQTEQQQIGAMPPEQQLAPLARAMELDTFFARRGMPSTRFNQCIGNMAAVRQLAENTNRAGTQENVTGTPSFFINGEQQQASSWQALEPQLRAAIGG